MRQTIAAIWALVTGALLAGNAWAQAYPVKPVRLIVANAPGGGADLVARLLSEKLTRPLGRQIIVENRPGGSGQIGADLVAKAAPDGYTLLLGTTLALISSPALHPNLPYKSPADFAPISLLASTTYVLVVHPSVPARTVKALAQLAKARPGGMSYASGGPGTVGHIASEMFASRVGAKLLNISYRGSGPGVFSVAQGETDLMFCNLLPAVPLLQMSRVRALGLASLKRSTLLPDVPTLHESGLPGFEVQQYYSLVAPAGTSGEIVSRLNEEIARHFQSPDVKSRLAGDGSEVRVSTPAELEKLIVSEIAKWTRTIREAGIRPE